MSIRMKRGLIALGLVALGTTVPTAYGANYIEVILTRADDKANDFVGFIGKVNIGLDASLGANSVSLGVENGGTTTLESPSSALTLGSFEYRFATFSQLQAAFKAEWTVSVEGTSDSQSSFTLDLSGIGSVDLPGVPTNLFPADATTLSGTPSTFTWTAPPSHLYETQPYTKLDNVEYYLTPLAATSWTHGQTLGNGSHEFGVGYLITEETEAIGGGGGIGGGFGFFPPPRRRSSRLWQARSIGPPLRAARWPVGPMTK